MKNYMQRGKVDVFITYEDLHAVSCGALKYNRELAAEYLEYLRADGRGIRPGE